MATAVPYGIERGTGQHRSRATSQPFFHQRVALAMPPAKAASRNPQLPRLLDGIGGERIGAQVVAAGGLRRVLEAPGRIGGRPSFRREPIGCRDST